MLFAASSSVASQLEWGDLIDPEAQTYEDPYRGHRRPGDNLEQIIIEQIEAANQQIEVAVQELRSPLIAFQTFANGKRPPQELCMSYRDPTPKRSPWHPPKHQPNRQTG